MQSIEASGLRRLSSALHLPLSVSCLLFAWSAHSYRFAVGLLAALLTLASVRAVFGGSPDLLPAAVAAWLALALTRRPATA